MPKKFSIILADPPWQYKAWKGDKGSRTAESYYETMTMDQIKKLKVKKIAAENCALFLWTTAPFLYVGDEVMEAWGFTYKTIAFHWTKVTKNSTPYEDDKPSFGMGHYTRGNLELCLLGMKGSLPRFAKNVRQEIRTPIEHHSKKPDEQYERIEALFGDIPRIELFARQKWPGWHVWGKEAPEN